MSLQDFLNNNLVDNLTEEVVVSPRFKDESGNLLKFKIKAMTGPEFEEVRKSAMSIRKGKKVEFDSQKFNLQIIINNTLVPDFKHTESLQKVGCNLPEEYVLKVLLAGEMTTLVNEIQKLSGFDVDMETLVEEAKN